MALPRNLPDKFLARNGQIISAGLDEAGRGCLAGPVVSCAVILPGNFFLAGLDDSKRLAPGKRNNIAKQLRSSVSIWSLGVVWSRRIDKINILAATLESMAQAVGRLKIAPHLLLIDGNQTIPEEVLGQHCRKLALRDLPGQRAIVRGDQLVPAISAASVLAKTFRDKLMICLARKWPQYGFEIHKGYGTAQHLAALEKYGPCPIHRMTFRGVRQGRLPL